MRILAASKPLPLEKMGFSERNLAEFKTILAEALRDLPRASAPPARARPPRCTPALGFINTVDMKIWTAEDPVEITQPGLRQVQVHPKIGFTFAAAMRAFLRADPDVIMVGEMRDHETAATGIEASLTGHLVLSTLHTNSAPETIVRLLDMDIDPFNFADALLGILAQRLVRTLCARARRSTRRRQEEFAELMRGVRGRALAEARASLVPVASGSYRPKGCPKLRRHRLQGAHGHPRAAGRDRRAQAHDPEAQRPSRSCAQRAIQEGMTHAAPGRHPEGPARPHGLQAGPRGLHQVGGEMANWMGGSAPRWRPRSPTATSS